MRVWKMEQKVCRSLSLLHQMALFFLFCLVCVRFSPRSVTVVGGRRGNESVTVSNDWHHGGHRPLWAWQMLKLTFSNKIPSLWSLKWGSLSLGEPICILAFPLLVLKQVPGIRWELGCVQQHLTPAIFFFMHICQRKFSGSQYPENPADICEFRPVLRQ